MSIYHAFALGSHFEPQVLKQLLVELGEHITFLTIWRIFVSIWYWEDER